MLKQNLFKNVSNGPAFCDKKGWIWPQWYDWNKNEKNTLIRSSFPLPHMNFQTILRPKEISAKFLSEKNGPLKPFWFFCFIYRYSWEIKLFFAFFSPGFCECVRGRWTRLLLLQRSCCWAHQLWQSKSNYSIVKCVYMLATV